MKKLRHIDKQLKSMSGNKISMNKRTINILVINKNNCNYILKLQFQNAKSILMLSKNVIHLCFNVIKIVFPLLLKNSFTYYVFDT